MDYTDDMTVEEAGKRINKSRKSKPKKKEEAGDKGSFMEAITEPFRKIEKAMKKRTSGESMREKHFPKKKK